MSRRGFIRSLIGDKILVYRLFAASVMKQLRRPIRPSDLAAEDQDELAQNSSCMLTHKQGTFCRVVDFWINTRGAAVGLSRVPQNQQNLRHMSCETMCLFLAARTRKKILEYNDSYSSLLVQLQHCYLDIAQEISNPPLWDHVLELQRQRRAP